MIPLVGDWSIRCMQLAAGVASLYFCHAIYNRNIADIPPYQLGPIAISSDSESESEILERSLGTVLDRTKQIVITGFKKAASLFITDEETLVQGLSTYVDSIYDHPKVQKRFPIKPEILRPSDVVLAHSWAGKRVCIGSGQMGAVYLGFNKIAGKKVAIKFATDRRCDINFMIHEASLMTHLNDTGATPFCHGLMPVRSGTNHPMAALVMDLVGGEINNKPLDIASFIQENKGKLNSEEYRSLFIDITEKIGRIHDKGVVINDIKEENILVYKKSTSGIGTSIIDFGSSRYGDYTFCLNRQLNKEVYYSEYSHMAPEIFERHRVTPVSDVYSLSGIFCDMGKLLGYGDLMYVGIKCTRVDPDTRPNIEKVKKLLSEMDLESEEDISL